jgi:hypothetical protein
MTAMDIAFDVLVLQINVRRVSLFLIPTADLILTGGKGILHAELRSSGDDQLSRRWGNGFLWRGCWDSLLFRDNLKLRLRDLSSTLVTLGTYWHPGTAIWALNLRFYLFLRKW